LRLIYFEKANIILDNAGKVGIKGMTRVGMKEREMETIASFINDIKNGINPIVSS